MRVEYEEKNGGKQISRKRRNRVPKCPVVLKIVS
jgi:hypothetical protein